MALRPYTRSEIWDAAARNGVDPVLAEAIYMRESSSGKDPKALGVRYVRYPKGGGGTYIRGPFQVSDDTAAGIARNNGLGKVDLDNPDTHLDLAMRLIKELKGQYGDNPAEIARGYHGGPAGIKNPNAKDELGTSSGAYAQDILRNMSKIRAERGGDDAGSNSGFGNNPLLLPSPVETPYSRETPAIAGLTIGDDGGGGDDLFGMPSNMGLSESKPSWSDFLARAERGWRLGKDVGAEPAPMGDYPDMGPVGLGIPEEQGGDLSIGTVEPATSFDVDAYIASIVNDQMKDRDFSNAA
jgi:hypothetical protein